MWYLSFTPALAFGKEEYGGFPYKRIRVGSFKIARNIVGGVGVPAIRGMDSNLENQGSPTPATAFDCRACSCRGA